MTNVAAAPSATGESRTPWRPWSTPDRTPRWAVRSAAQACTSVQPGRIASVATMANASMLRCFMVRTLGSGRGASAVPSYVIVLRDRSRTLREQKMMGERRRRALRRGTGAVRRCPPRVQRHGRGAEAGCSTRRRAPGYAVDAALLAGHGTRVEELQEARLRRVGGRRARAAAGRPRRATGASCSSGSRSGSLVAMQLASEEPDGLAGLVALGNALTLHAAMRVPIAPLASSRPADAGRLHAQAARGRPRRRSAPWTRSSPTTATRCGRPSRSTAQGARVRGVVGRIACPTLILHGRRDRVCSWRNAVVAGRSHRRARRQRAHLREERARPRAATASAKRSPARSLGFG